MANDESKSKRWEVTTRERDVEVVDAERVSVDEGVLWLVDGGSGTLVIKGVFATGQWISALEVVKPSE